MICPNCNNNVQDGSNLCNWCGYSFQQNNAYIQHNYNNKKQYQNYTNSKNYQGNNDFYKIKQFYEQQVKIKNAFTFFYITCAIGIIGAIISALSIFAPFLKASYMYQYASVSLFSTRQADSIFIILCSLILLIYSLPNKKYTKRDGIGKLIISILNVASLIYSVYNINYNFNNSEWIYVVSLEYGAGFYLILIGNIMSAISGIMLCYIYSDKYISKIKK